MWLVILAFSAIISTALWYSTAEDDKYMLRVLSLIFWGAAIMVFIDKVLGYLMRGEELIEMTLEAAALGFIAITVALLIWLIILLLKDLKGVLHKKG